MMDALSESALAISMICWSATERPFAIRRGSRPDTETVDDDGDLLIHRLEVDAAPAAQRFATDEDVLGDTEVWEHRCFLVDYGDPSGPRSGGAVQGHLPAIDDKSAAIGLVNAGQDLDQRRLAGSVLADKGVGLARAQLDVAVDERMHCTE